MMCSNILLHIKVCLKNKITIYFIFIKKHGIFGLGKKHGGLHGKTPAEEALIHVSGQNKLLTLIQNASLEKSRNSI